MRLTSGTRKGSDNGKPAARPGRKATGLARDSRATEEPFPQFHLGIRRRQMIA